MSTQAMGHRSLLATIAGNARTLLELGSAHELSDVEVYRLRVELRAAMRELDRRFPVATDVEAPDAGHGAADIKWRTSLTTEELRQIIADRLTSTRRRR
jgi:hypothetical protein